MTLGTVSAPSRLVRRRHTAMWLPLAVGLAVGVALWSAGERGGAARSSAPPALNVCAYPAEPAPPPAPRTDAWAGLERCLHQDAYALAAHVTVADVSRWVLVEGDRIWFHEDRWWFPLSGEGDPQVPSGAYVGVPLDVSAPCAGAIIN